MVSLLLGCTGCRHGVRRPVFMSERSFQQGFSCEHPDIFFSLGKWLARMTTYKRANRIVWILTDQASLLICFIPAQSSGHLSHLSREETLDFLLFLIGKSVAGPNFLWLNDIHFFLDDFHRKLRGKDAGFLMFSLPGWLCLCSTSRELAAQ